ncbi:MAG: 1-(5-phosphoribosyl)-5-[(5-phosphoribosylamino)methylideneamino]imidazole-4-carboxamide isomerase [Lentisphaerae bacterium GWF2_44_16]|nr:MAG: 1-(5-phosphoribosyl)-5-[(5-phosphoribosylamino)methylideneamino]imidazole-4-carboxamide isomerase [Lentisphaerae bacterium GWF2_44_16]
MIILPAVDIRNGKCVRLVQGDYNKETIYSERPEEEALRWQKEGAEFLHLVDLDGAKKGCPWNIEAIRNICMKVNVPCELGGGIRTAEDADRIFSLGIVRIIIGTAACEKPSLVRELIENFGTDRIVLGIDAKNGKTAVRGWLKSTEIAPVALAEKFAEAGIVRIIYTDISTDGMLSGPNFEGIALLCDKVPSCKIIASGGMSSADDVRKLKALGKPNLEGAIVGKALYDGRTTLKELMAFSAVQLQS